MTMGKGMYWNIDHKLKKRMLVRYIKKEEPIKYGITWFVWLVLNIIGIGLMLFISISFSAALITAGKVHGIASICGDIIPVILIGILFWFIPAIIAYAIRRRAVLKIGWPYSEREKEFIHLEKAGIEFAYHDVSRNIKENMNLYQIYYEDIRKLEYDEETMMLTITGAAEITAYDDFVNKRINFGLSGRRLHSESKYSFILATKNATKIIDEICKHVEPYVAQIYRGEELIL